MAKKVLVTGGTGFIGSNLIYGLLREGWEIRIFDNFSRNKDERQPWIRHQLSDVEVVHGDIRDASAVDRAVQGCTAVAHLAFINGTKYFYERPRDVLEVGVKGALNTLESGLKHGIEEYWLMSSSEVYQTPDLLPTPESEICKIPDTRNSRYSYGGGKLISEIMAFNYGRGNFSKTVVVRPHNVYGPNMGWEHVIPDFISRAWTQFSDGGWSVIDFPIIGTGQETRAFCYIDDFVDGCLKAYLHGEDQQIYHVGTSVETKVEELATLICQKIGCEPAIVPSKAREGETSRRVPDISKVQELGYQPKISLSDGLDPTIKWYVEQLERKSTLAT